MKSFTRTQARQTLIIEFVDSDGHEQGGVVGATGPETFSVVSHPRYGDTKSRTFRYEDVVTISRIEPRRPVHLATFSRLMAPATR